MIILHHSWGTIHAGYRIEHEIPDWSGLDSYFWQKFLAFTMLNRGFYPVWDAFLTTKKTEFDSLIAVLEAHGHYQNGQWCYQSSATESKPIQDWVNEQDGKAIMLLILACNPQNKGKLVSNKSLVIHSRSNLSVNGMESKRSRQIIHVPNFGSFIGTTDRNRLEKIAKQIRECQT